MSETRFTPGPWQAVNYTENEEAVYFVVPPDWKGSIAAVRSRNGEKAAANAHLIAAAPTLYDTAAETVPALRRLIAEMNLGPDGEGRDWLDMLTACADDLDAAMAKARGEA